MGYTAPSANSHHQSKLDSWKTAPKSNSDSGSVDLFEGTTYKQLHTGLSVRLPIVVASAQSDSERLELTDSHLQLAILRRVCFALCLALLPWFGPSVRICLCSLGSMNYRCRRNEVAPQGR